MKVSIQAPFAGAAYVLPGMTSEMVLQPIFSGPRDRQTVFYAVVASDTGRTRRYTLDVHAGTGRLILSEIKETVADFDRLAEDAEDAKLPLSVADPGEGDAP